MSEKFESIVDPKNEGQLLINRITKNDNILMKFADYYEIQYKRNIYQTIDTNDKGRVFSILHQRFNIEDILKIYSNNTLRKEWISCNGFYGLYYTIKRNNNNEYDYHKVTLWNDIYSNAKKLLNNKHNNTNKRVNMILRAIIEKFQLNDQTMTYICEKNDLLNKAHQLADYNENTKPWYNDIGYLVSIGLIFDTSSNKYRRIELPIELLPLVKLLTYKDTDEIGGY